MTETKERPDSETAPEAGAADRAVPKERRKPSVALSRFNDYVVSALGTAQRDWLLSVQGLDTLPETDADGRRALRAESRIDHQTLRRQANLDAILFRALSRLPTGVEDGTVDPDWSARFFDQAADCADPERQALWARLLVMEVNKPGSVPLVAIRVLAGLSPRMVDWVRVVAGLSINNFFMRLSDDFNAERGLVGDVILLLEEYGIVRTNKDMTKVFKSQVEEKFTTNLLYNDKIIRVVHNDPKKELVLPCFRLTDAGAALTRALQQEEGLPADTEYIVEIVKLVQKQGCTVMHADILKRASENVVSKHSTFSEIVALNGRHAG